jgi:uncharacterized protein YcfJ
MKRKSKRLLVALVLIGVLAAGGAAFTAALSVPNTTAGYGSSTITGATADKIVYNLNGPGTQITSVTVDLHTPSTGDLTTGYTVQGAFDGLTLVGCTVDATYGTNGYSSGAGNTQFTCGPYTESTSGSSSFAVTVTNS